MALTKVDGVIEAVRYDEQGQLSMARLYKRMGPTFTDYVLLDRAQLVEMLQKNKRIYIGERLPRLSSSFRLGKQIFLTGPAGQEVLSTSRSQVPEHDQLSGVPLF